MLHSTAQAAESLLVGDILVPYCHLELTTSFSLPALWDVTGWKVWFFTRSSIPGDISNGAPLPTTWGTPMADFPSTSCDAFKFFYQHSAVFDTTLWYVYLSTPAPIHFC